MGPTFTIIIQVLFFLKTMKGVDVDVIVIKFSIYNQRLRRITSSIIPSNSYGKLKFEFDFRTTDWNKGKTKTAHFYYNGENKYVDLDENNQCFVPEEVIYTPSFSVSVHNEDIITNTITITVQGDSEYIQPSAYHELLKLIKEHTHEEYVEDDEIEEVLPSTFDAGKIIED